MELRFKIYNKKTGKLRPDYFYIGRDGNIILSNGITITDEVVVHQLVGKDKNGYDIYEARGNK